MPMKLNNKGVSLLELIVAAAIMAVLAGVMVPTMFGYVEKAKKVRVEKEAGEFVRAAQVALIEVTSMGKAPGADCIKNKTETTSLYYRDGRLYGNLTNWTVHNGVVAGASNSTFADTFFNILDIPYGKGVWTTRSSTVPISENQPKLNQAGSLTKECIFQVFYDKDGNVIVEYSREGYFVRMENGLLIESVKVKNATEKHFTVWKG